ncbi:2-oxoglutarate ferredoxin oxidoreductase subunit gamma [Desulfohalotomaculum tongense]|uniref:2-oxoacid:acceptor oxidoreductase family protein n=1 Tax=Desulforadius tongensis TaxID=1216062 RepID=UPI00195DEFAC|nr:2-oxoacid:acceptor oxidoreductase family protein [Desulforadius tongensis]MBM7854749.1 2-oxoglutarate ferredoxin oxidoreductase subunit gamma [Desulforadius tongensis]
MAQSWEVRLSGSGGQGLILAGIILAEAGILDGQNVVQTQSYGPAARGGASKAEVIISPGDIDYPKVLACDVLLALNQESCIKYSGDLKNNSVTIVDSSLVKHIPPVAGKIYPLPITKTAREEVGRELVANVVALGALVGLTGVVSREAITNALMARVPRGTEELNAKALEVGFKMAAEARNSQKNVQQVS